MISQTFFYYFSYIYIKRKRMIMKNKIKICVYAICKNEEKHIERWIESVKEADDIYVLDTGSTDNSVKLLKKKGCHVKVKKIDPWRFDVARNLSLEMIPKDADVCVCLDLDEIFLPGWRQEIEQIWDSNTTRLKYMYHWKLKEDGTPLVYFYTDKIHARQGYHWKHPVHEVLTYQENKMEVFKTASNILLKHYPDIKKSRSSYLPLLELSVKESPEDDRNTHYLGREYMFYEKWNEAIDTLIKHLSLKSATWKDERCASMRFISRCYLALNRPLEAEMWLTKAIEEAPYLREPYIEKAFLLYQQQRYQEVITNCELALTINIKERNYIQESFCFDSTIDDLLSISYYQLGNLDQAILHAKQALEYNDKDERLKKNWNLLVQEKKKKTNN